MPHHASVILTRHARVTHAQGASKSVASRRALALQASRPLFQDVNNNPKADALSGVAQDAPVVVLVRPFLDQNVGATARAMLNFGLGELRLVSPQCDHLSDDARARASGADIILDSSRVFQSVEDATGDLHRTYALTARLRDMTQIVLTPSEVASRIAEAGATGATAETPLRSGVVFGPERSGLTNSDMASVDAIVQIPTNPNFASLNLAQVRTEVDVQCGAHASGVGCSLPHVEHACLCQTHARGVHAFVSSFFADVDIALRQAVNLIAYECYQQRLKVERGTPQPDRAQPSFHEHFFWGLPCSAELAPWK